MNQQNKFIIIYNMNSFTGTDVYGIIQLMIL
jgi:hypothetical protein